MKHTVTFMLTAASLLLGPVGQAMAEEEGNWKRGRIYYHSVCTACHTDELGKSVSPAEKTIAEWKLYLASETGSGHVGEFVSQDYRNMVAGENKVAGKFAPISNEDMLADVRAFVIHGAKDSATPATCN